MKRLLFALLALALLAPMSKAGCGYSCYTPSYYAPSYYYPTYTYYNYGTWDYVPGYGLRYFPPGSYYSSGGYWYRAGYAGPYYGLPYSVYAVQIPDPTIVEIEIPQPVVVNTAVAINPPNVLAQPQQAQIPTGPSLIPQATMPPREVPAPATASASVSLTSDDIKVFVGTMKNLSDTVAEMRKDNARLAEGLKAVQADLDKVKKQMAPPPMPKEEKK